MSAGYFDKAVRLSFGQVAAGAAIEVRHTGGGLADIYSNAAMTTPLSNPGVMGDDGRYEFYALFGVYNITVGAGASAATYRFKLDSDGVTFLTRADFVSAVADGYAPPGGTVVTIGSLSWMVIPVGHADYGTDPISDLPGWMPVGEVYIEHAGGGTGATATANQNALDELFAAYDEVNLGYGSYQLGAGYTITGNRKRLVGQRQGRTYLYHTGSTCYGIKFAPATLDGSVYSSGGNLQGVTIVGPGVSHTDGVGLEVSMHNGFLCQDVSVQGFRNGALVSGGQFFSFRDFEVFAPTGGAVADVSDTYLFAVMPFDGGVNGWKHTYNVNVSRYQFGGDVDKNVQDAILLGCGDGTRFSQGYVAYSRRAICCVKPSGPISAGNITATSFTDSYFDGVDAGSSTGVPYGVYFDATTETGLTNYIMFGSGCFIGNNTISAVYGHAGHMRGVFFDGANISGSGGRNIDIEGTSGASGTRLSLTNCQVRAGEGALFNDLRMLTIDGCQFTDATDNHAIELAGSIGSLAIDGNIMSGNVSDFSSTATITDAAWGDNVGDFGRGGHLYGTDSLASRNLPTGLYQYKASDIPDAPETEAWSHLLEVTYNPDIDRRHYVAKRITTSVSTTRMWSGIEDGAGNIVWSPVPIGPFLVGPVGQSGGVVTGAVIERGSNANGEYVRFADGTQICWVKDFDLGSIVGAGSGTFADPYSTPVAANITWPAVFISAPVVAHSLRISGDTVVNTGSRSLLLQQTFGASTTGWNSLRAQRVSADTIDRNALLSVKAIGRWF